MTEATSSTSISASTTITTLTHNTITPATSIDSVPTARRYHHYRPTRSLSLKATKDVSSHISLHQNRTNAASCTCAEYTCCRCLFLFLFPPTETILSRSLPFTASIHLRAGNNSALVYVFPASSQTRLGELDYNWLCDSPRSLPSYYVHLRSER